MDNLFLSIFLAGGTFFDLKYKGLPKWFLAGGFLFSLFLYGAYRPVSIKEMLLGMSVGGILLLVSLITRGALGFGDGLFLMIIGIVSGIGVVIQVLGFGLIISAFFSLLFLFFHKVTRKTSMPFVPFLAAAYLIVLLEQGGVI